MRITTNMVRRNYQSSLNSSLTALDQARNQVETGRRFTSSHEDPIAAAKGTILENRYARNNDYLNSTKEMLKWQDSQEDALTQINDISKEVYNKYSVEALNDTNDAGREAYAATFRALQESMVHSLNIKYGDAYVLAGQDGDNAPFVIEDDGTVTYRGIDVNSTDPADQAVLAELAEESTYVDLGYGLTFDAAGEIIPSSAFDSSVPGISAVGFGHNADGVSQNMVVLLGQMADELEKDPFDRDTYVGMWESFGAQADVVRNEISIIGTKSALLTATESRLEGEEINIIEQFDDAVNIEASEAIMNFSYADYVYNAALKVGMNVLTPSLLDFMQ